MDRKSMCGETGELLFDDAGVWVFRRGETLVVTAVARHFWEMILGVAGVFMFPCAIAFSLVIIDLFRRIRDFIPSEVGGFIFMTFLFGMLNICSWIMALWGTLALLQASFPRRFSFDLSAGTCLFQNLPGLRRVISLERIHSVNLLIVELGVKGYYAGRLALSINGMKRYLQIQSAEGRLSKEEAVARLQPVGEFLSRSLGVPLRLHEDNRPGLISWL